MAGNPCLGGLDTTVAQPDGTLSVQKFIPAKNPKIDCFYVYPTLSEAKSTAAPLAPEPAAVDTTRAQVGRFQSVCRLFVPVYRQVTLAGLAGMLAGKPVPQSVRDQATADVVSAWHDYLDHYNDGRGVVLLGHSQGAGEVISLLSSEVDRSSAERALLVSAIALGGNLLVPQGKDVGGDLMNIPACRQVTQHGCVVAYSMFNTIPPPGSFFGRTVSPGMEVLCVNPAALSEGARPGGTAPLHPEFPTRGSGGNHLGLASDLLLNAKTDFVSYPGQLTGTCRDTGGASWLQIDHPHQGVKGKNAVVAQTLGPQWGLHLYDFNADQDDLVKLVSDQAAAWK